MSIEASSEMAQITTSQDPSSNDVKGKAIATEDDDKPNAESKTDAVAAAAAAVAVEKNINGAEKGESSSSSPSPSPSSAPTDERGLLNDLKEYETNALIDLRSKLEDAILTNTLFKEKKEPQKEEKPVEEEKHGESSEDREKPKSNEGEKTHEIVEEKGVEEMEKDKAVALWGVPLLPSKGVKATDVVLLKFLRSRDYKVNEAFEMLRNTLQWRKEFMIDSIMEEDFGTAYESMAYMNGVDREGHSVCYNVYGIFADDEIYNKAFGTEEGRQKFLRWRLRMMEKEIQKLDFEPGSTSSLLQVNDLNNTPGLSRKDLRLATQQAVTLLQNNYPEFVARNIFINVPFWYYAFNALLSPFLTQRTKSKFVFARPARVTETLVKYIAAEEIPIQYGGFKRDSDSEFSTKDGVSETTIRAGSTGTIEIPAPEVGTTFVWDLIVLGWEVNYKEEFVPTDERSYTIIVQKERRMGWQEGPLRNSFKNNEPGKILITIENATLKKKRVLYRYKTKKNSSS